MKDLFIKRIENFKNLELIEKDVFSACEIIKNSLMNGNKILFCGNGGSASDSNHLAAEFISKFEKSRNSLPAISLSANNSVITAVSNDFGFENIFKKQIEGLGKENDVLFAISASAKSKNIIEAIKKAKELKLKTILLTGKNKTDLKCDIELNVPSENTAEIQEMHIALGHIICKKIEQDFD